MIITSENELTNKLCLDRLKNAKKNCLQDKYEICRKNERFKKRGRSSRTIIGEEYFIDFIHVAKITGVYWSAKPIYHFGGTE